MPVFYYRGYMICLSNVCGENYEHFAIRGNFIAKQQPRSEFDLNEAIRYSKIYLNIIVNGVSYSDEIMAKINKMAMMDAD